MKLKISQSGRGQQPLTSTFFQPSQKVTDYYFCVTISPLYGRLVKKCKQYYLQENP